MNTKIALSAMSILTSLALVGGATFAFFSDTGTSSANSFSTGTLTLKLSDSAVNGGLLETDVDSVTSSFGGSLNPGQCTGTQTLTLKNTGSIAANHAEVKLANVVTDTGSAATPDIDSYLRISSLTYDGGDVTGQIVDQGSDGNAFLDLADWAATVAALDSLALTDLNTGHNLVLNVCLDSSAPNEVQGDSILSTFTVNLNQDVSQ